MTSPSPGHSLCWVSSDIPKQIEIVCAQTRAALESDHLASSDPISRYRVGLFNRGPWCVASNVISYSLSRLASIAIFLIVLNISPNLVDGGTALPLIPPDRALSPCGVSPGTPIACRVSAGTLDAEACLERTRTSSTGKPVLSSCSLSIPSARICRLSIRRICTSNSSCLVTKPCGKSCSSPHPSILSTSDKMFIEAVSFVEDRSKVPMKVGQEGWFKTLGFKFNSYLFHSTPRGTNGRSER